MLEPREPRGSRTVRFVALIVVGAVAVVGALITMLAPGFDPSAPGELRFSVRVSHGIPAPLGVVLTLSIACGMIAVVGGSARLVQLRRTPEPVRTRPLSAWARPRRSPVRGADSDGAGRSAADRTGSDRETG